MNNLREHKARALRDAFERGLGTRAAARHAGCSKVTASRLRKLWGFADMLCACGRPAVHQGWCKVRVAASPGRREYVARRRGEQTPEALAATYMPMTRALVAAAIKKLPPYVDWNDLESAAMLGLWQAAMRFEHKQGIPFGAYAKRRICGAIVDELRRLSPLSRAEAKRWRDGDQFDRRIFISLDMLAEGTEDGHGWEPSVPAVERDHFAHARIDVALDALTHRERTALERICEGDRQVDIARTLGVVESRVSQLRTAALVKLRRSLS